MSAPDNADQYVGTATADQAPLLRFDVPPKSVYMRYRELLPRFATVVCAFKIDDLDGAYFAQWTPLGFDNDDSVERLLGRDAKKELALACAHAFVRGNPNQIRELPPKGPE